MGTTKKLLKTAAAGALLGCTVYVANDVASEYTTFVQLRDRALKLAEDSTELKHQIGYPFSVAPWYNASIAVSHTAHIASIKFQLQGDKQVTDVTVRGVRRPTLIPSLALYNLVGPAEWKVMDCSAMFPAGGGLVRSRSLLPEEPMPKIIDGKIVEGEECETCKRPPLSGQQASQQSAAAGPSQQQQQQAGAQAAGASAAGAAGAAVSGAEQQQQQQQQAQQQAQQSQRQESGVPKGRKRFWLF